MFRKKNNIANYDNVWKVCFQSLERLLQKYYLMLFVIAFLIFWPILFIFILFFGYVASGIFVPCESHSVVSDPV